MDTGGSGLHDQHRNSARKRGGHMIDHETVIYESKRFPFENFEASLDIDRMRIRVQKFINSRKVAAPIALKDLHRYKTAWFEHGHPNVNMWDSLSNVITGWKICGDILIAVKVWKRNGEMRVEQRKYPMKNYGKTWRCWTAVPTHEQRERTAWPDE